MKRLITASLVSLLLVGGFGTLIAAAPVSVPHAHAQNSTGSGPNPSQLGATPATPTGGAPTDPGECGIKNPFACILAGFAAFVQLIMQLCAWLLGVAALLLDYVVYFTILKMGAYVNGLSAVGITWRILRDVGNIVLIFGFIAVGISVILDSDWYGGGKKLLPILIVVAVFLNFSLFISEAIIDAGNLFATELYTQINGGHSASLVPFSTTSINTDGISNKIMNQLGFTNIFGAANDPKNLSYGTQIGIGFMGIILFIVAAFVFFSLVFILLARFVILLLLIIVAPLGFAGLAVPKLSDTAKKWWSTLIDQTLTAPILLLLLYVALKVITDDSFLAELGACQPNTTTDCSTQAAAAWTAPFNQGSLSSFGGVLLSFLVAMGLLLTVTYMSKKMSAFGGSWATRMGGRLSFGLAAYGLRSTAGRASTGLGRRWQSSRLARIPVLGSSVSKALTYGGKSSFDIRGSSAWKGLPLKVDAGKPQSGGYAGAEKKAVEERVKYAKSLQMTKGEKQEQDAAKKTKEEEEKRVIMMRNSVKAVQDQNAEEARQLRTKQASEMAPLASEVEATQKAFARAKTELSAAEAKDSAGSTAETAAALAAARAAHSAAEKKSGEATKARDELKAKQEAALAEQREAHNAVLTAQNEEFEKHKQEREDAKAKIAELGARPQTTYAQRLRANLDEKSFFNRRINSYANVASSKKILEEAKKNKDQKKKDELYDLFEKVAKDKEGGGKEKDGEEH